MRWKPLLAVLIGLLMVGTLGRAVYAEQYPAPEASEKISTNEKITVDGVNVPLRKMSNGMIIIGQTSEVGRGDILEKVNQLMVKRVLNKWNDVTIESNYGNVITKSDYNYRVTTLKLNDNKKIKLSVGAALSARFRIDYYDPVETVDFSVYHYAYSTAIMEYPPYITYQYNCKSIKLINKLSFYGETYTDGWSIGVTISLPPGLSIQVSGGSSWVSIDGSFGEDSVSNYDSISHPYDGTLTVYDYFKVRIYRVSSKPIATFEVKKGVFRSLDTSTSVAVDSSAF
ncbi:hypothetical protein TON_1500 [Thermococcus onnurineus NA1]|uniref:Uncharacterized protein n=1 Tax=Thermococcus onnurineus (strain NA1) TaxID=523850 RepID=B6YTP9_THEON|nr:hypothetical protein [Thermococcus onnurineus]ACJ16990.1 hypothetical protein TON_1500 [Thermococcus onnurineus NA1]